MNQIKDAPKDCLTIVIPSKGRAAQLTTLLNYFSLAQVEYPILVLLSEDRNKYCPDQYPLLNINFLEFEEDIDIYEKIEEGLRKVSTPLVAMCTDDDIVLAEGLKKAGGFLMENPEYSACQGYHALFSQDTNIINLVSVPWFTPSIDLNNPLDRLNNLMHRYQPVCWAVFRTVTMTQVTHMLWKKYKLFVFQELLWSATSAILGKVKRLPFIYCLRRIDQIHLSGHPLFAMMESPQIFFSEYTFYRNKLANLLAPTVSLDRSTLDRTIDLIHTCFFAREIAPSTLNFFTDHVLSNPLTSIHDSKIDHALRAPALDLESGWEYETFYGGRVYRFFPDFLHPEPKSEIPLPPNFGYEIMTDIQKYFR